MSIWHSADEIPKDQTKCIIGVDGDFIGVLHFNSLEWVDDAGDELHCYKRWCYLHELVSAVNE